MHMNMNALIHDVHRIREALVIRGFSVRALHNRLIPEQGAAWYEWEDLQSVLDRAGVVYRAAARSLAILDAGVPEEAVREIQYHKPVRVMQEPQWYETNWKSFTRRKFGRTISALDLSPGVAYLVKSLGKAGILTAFSSDGRGKGRPYVEFAGPWNGVWFEYLFNHHMLLGDLHYAWSVKPNIYGYVRLSPGMPSGRQQWDLTKIQQDTVRMGRWLNRFAADIREMKRMCFKYRSMKREAEARAEDYEGLKRWMYGKIAEKYGFARLDQELVV
jgi:hypothetical protein